MENKKTYNSEDEIDLLELFRIIWSGKKTIIRFVIIFGLIGLFIAVFSEKEYTASMIVVPQTSDSKIGGSLGGLAAMAGINVGSGSIESIPPSLYPEIAKSIPFKRGLLDVPLKFANLKEEITYEEYYQKHKKSSVLSVIKSYTIGLPNKMFSLFKAKPKPKPKNRVEVGKAAIFRISAKENRLFNQLQGQLLIDNNKKDGFVKISFSMPEALPAAQMTKKAQELLQTAITNFKIQKAKEEFNFIEERYTELKTDFEKKQAVLARFRDRNQGLVTSRSQSRIEILQSEYNLAFSIYSQLAKQLETQKLKLKENSPVFTILEPVSVPMGSSKPKRVMIFFGWLFLGFVLSVGFIFGKKMIKKLKKYGNKLT